MSHGAAASAELLVDNCVDFASRWSAISALAEHLFINIYYTLSYFVTFEVFNILIFHFNALYTTVY